MRAPGHRWAGAGAFLAAASLAYAVFRVGVRPGMVVETRRVEEEMAQLNASADPGRAGLSRPEAGEAAELAGELARMEERVAALRGVLAFSGEPEAVLQSLGATAAAAGVRFLRFAPEPGVQMDGYLASAVSVVAEGTFVDLLRFFDRVSLSPHLILMEEVTLERSAGDLLQCRFVAVTVRAAGDPAPGGPETEEPASGLAER